MTSEERLAYLSYRDRMRHASRCYWLKGRPARAAKYIGQAQEIARFWSTRGGFQAWQQRELWAAKCAIFVFEQEDEERNGS